MPGTRRKGSEAPHDDVPPEELLRTSPFDGNLTEELAAAEPRPGRRPPSATVFLGAGVLIVAGFIGGVQADKHWGTKQSPGAAAFNRFAGAAGQRGQGQNGGYGGGAGRRGGFGQGTGSSPGDAAPGGGASGSGGTAGTVKLVDGDIIYVQTANGIVRVKTTGSTKVAVSKNAKVKDLKTGVPVVVQGTSGQDGTVTATTVTQNP